MTERYRAECTTESTLAISRQSHPYRAKIDVTTMKNLESLLKAAAQVIVDCQEDSGAFPAAPDFEHYQYCWFRDGSFIADAMSRAGYVGAAEAFFDWGAKVIGERSKRILAGDKLDARFTYGGQEVTDEEWQNFQLDGYGVWLWSLRRHIKRHNRSVERYRVPAALAQYYLVTHWQQPCVDWWEERTGVHAATLACIYAGLKEWSHPEAQAVKDAIKLSAEPRVDSSLLIVGILGAVDEKEFQSTLERIELENVSFGRGVYRYRGDKYYGGGEWPVLTAMLGWYYLKIGRVDEARQKLSWISERIRDHHIAEQYQENLLDVKSYQKWVDRWGAPANPLLWSHAMFITLGYEILAHDDPKRYGKPPKRIAIKTAVETKKSKKKTPA